MERDHGDPNQHPGRLTAGTSNVSASGSVQHIITDQEVQTFGIQDDALKNAVNAYFGQRPNDAYLHSDTPWGDLYRTYGWPQVQTVLVVDSATVTEITSQPSIVAKQVFKNESDVAGTFNTGISQEVSNTVENTWSKSDTITVGEEIKYEVGFLGTGGGGKTSLSYSHTWGQSKTESIGITVGSTSGLSVPLNPGQSVNAQLTASRGRMKVRVVYRAYLIGATAVNYNPTYSDHHFWCLDIGSVMSAGGIPNTQTFTEDLEIGFYANSEIILSNPSTGMKLKAFSSLAIPAGSAMISKKSPLLQEKKAAAGSPVV